MTRRLFTPLVLGLVLVAAGLTLVSSQGVSDRQVIAMFPRTTSLYEGAKVKVLGVDVGRVESIEVVGTEVQVTMSYDDDVELPADVHALIVPPSIVGDRFVQLAPAYESGPVLSDRARLGRDHTGVPLELDDTYRGLDELTAALGPEGANKNGALSRLISATANSVDGNGQAFNTTIRELAAAIDTLAASSDDINGTVRHLGTITSTFAGKDAAMRRLVLNLATVSTQLNSQGDDITTSVKQLKQALRIVAAFVKDNRKALRTTVSGLTSVSGSLAKRTDELAELTDLAPVGLSNLANIYEPRNWDPTKPWLTPVEGRTGSQVQRSALYDDLDVQLGFALARLCVALPAAQQQQLAGFCTALRETGGDLGALVTALAGRDGALVLNPVPGATTLGGLLEGAQ